jgi:hypothetical protein
MTDDGSQLPGSAPNAKRSRKPQSLQDHGRAPDTRAGCGMQFSAGMDAPRMKPTVFSWPHQTLATKMPAISSGVSAADPALAGWRDLLPQSGQRGSGGGHVRALDDRHTPRDAVQPRGTIAANNGSAGQRVERIRVKLVGLQQP